MPDRINTNQNGANRVRSDLEVANLRNGKTKKKSSFEATNLKKGNTGNIGRAVSKENTGSQNRVSNSDSKKLNPIYTSDPNSRRENNSVSRGSVARGNTHPLGRGSATSTGRGSGSPVSRNTGNTGNKNNVTRNTGNTGGRGNTYVPSRNQGSTYSRSNATTTNRGQRQATPNRNYSPQRPGGGQRRKKKGGVNVPLIAISTFIVIFFAIYVGVSLYFTSHFLFNTTINGRDFSRQQVRDVRDYLEENIRDYRLTIMGMDGQTEVIMGSEVNLRLNDQGQIDEIFNNQNAFAWFASLFGQREYEVSFGIMYDRGALTNRVHSLQMARGEQTQPQNAHPVFDGHQYIIEPEVIGNTLDVAMLTDLVSDAVLNLNSDINLSVHGILEQPRLTANSSEIIDTRDRLNSILNASITYTMDVPVVVDRALITDWVSVDDELRITLDEDAISLWLRNFINQYQSHGTTRHLTTPTGRSVSVTGGYYGWRFDYETELEQLISEIRNGVQVTREPNFLPGFRAHAFAPIGSPDWGPEFLQVDLTHQHMWLIRHGEVVWETPIITGRPEGGWNTPQGVFSVIERLSPTVLEGPEDPDTGAPMWRANVQYWMRLTWCGIGFHDAGWQPDFGGNMYRTGYGSHGCINLPVDKARELYAMADYFFPVVVHY